MSLPRSIALTLTAIAASICTSQAAEDIINEFNSDTEATQWVRWWGAAQQTFTFDPAVDANTNASSGSLRVNIVWDNTSGDNQFAFRRDFSGNIDGSQYTNLVFDMMWDPSSATRSGNDFGYLEPGLKRGDWSQLWLTPLTVSTNPGWRRVTLPISATAQGIESIAGVILKMWAGNALNGPSTFWIDNVKLVAHTVLSNPPPRLGMEKAKPGLNLIASASGAQYQRQNIRTATPDYGWRGMVDPVTYSITISEAPGGNYSGFQTHVFIIPGASVAASQTDPDWHQPHTIFFHIGINANGSATATFRYKINQAGGNSMFWSTGALANISAPSPVGTWNLTFNPEGAGITMTSPQGNSTNFTMLPEHEAFFDGPAFAYFGIQPNEMRNIGQSAIIGQASITGVNNPVSDTFTSGPLDANKWQLSAQAASGVIPVPESAVGWLSWTLPDRDFVLEASSTLAPGSWAPYTNSATQMGDVKRALIMGSESEETLPLFFRMKKN